MAIDASIFAICSPLQGDVSIVELIQLGCDRWSREPGAASLYVLDGGGFCAFAVADLLRSELESTNAAAPARRRGVCDSRHWLLIGAPGSHQFATALRTLSLNHKSLHREEISDHSLCVSTSRVDRTSLLNGEPRRIAVAVPFLASRVISLVFGVSQRLGFGGSQPGIVTRFQSVFAGREVAL